MRDDSRFVRVGQLAPDFAIRDETAMNDEPSNAMTIAERLVEGTCGPWLACRPDAAFRSALITLAAALRSPLRRFDVPHG